MPIYEFYCPDCHTVFSFLSRKSDTETRPSCPRCKRRKLDRQISLFAVSKGRSDDAADDPALPPGVDETAMERALEDIASQAEAGSEDDPRHMARMMRKLQQATGLNLGEGVEEAIQRLEAGEDPEIIDAEMGDLLESEDAFAEPGGGKNRRLSRKLRPPNVDDGLYEM